MIISRSVFLVVLATSDCKDRRGSIGVALNPAYSGVNRVPFFPPDRPEEGDVYDYVLGDIKSYDSNLIEDEPVAIALLERLSRSPRKFEIIFCCDNIQDPKNRRVLLERHHDCLGYDISVIDGDYWPIVDDFSPHPELADFTKHLNQYVLFNSRIMATQYLEYYRNLREPDFDLNFTVTHIARKRQDEEKVPGIAIRSR